MFEPSIHQSRSQSLFSLLGLIYHSTVRSVRSSHRNAVIGLLLNMMQAVILVIAFLLLFRLIGVRTTPIRGDFLLFIMTGIFIYLTHIKSVSAVKGAEGPTSAMMQHAPMNTLVSMCASALSTLYTQVFSLIIILIIYHIAFTPITIDKPALALLMVLLAWFSGVCVGTIFFAMTPWAPGLVSILSVIYIRANMIASGKMFAANALPASKLAIFDWNPLFHIIDQLRGFAFLHYNPNFSSWEYALKISLLLLMIGMLGEFFTRKHASASWSAGR